jgi:RNA methyltransferase, TrmH family
MRRQVASQRMARCWLADGRCGRLGGHCPARQCVARTVRRLHERRWREKLGLFACEGEDLVAAATAEPVELFVAGENVEPKLLAEVSTAAHPPRVIGVYRRADLPAPEPRPVRLALWRLADPGNVGTLIRTADAFGAAVALSEGCADPTGPKALRASAGAIWRVPVTPVCDLDHIPQRRVALTPSPAGTPIGEAELCGEVAFLLGAEREGLPAELERDLDVWIPIGSQSLNVAAAGAIALYEWCRQNPGI